MFANLTVRFSRKPAAGFADLVEIADLLVIAERLFAAGDSTLGVIEWFGARGSGGLAARFRLLGERVRAGAELGDELSAWRLRASSLEFQDLLTKLISTTNSGADVTRIIANMAESVEGSVRANQLAALSKSEMRMMIPIVFLVLPITVMFAVFPSLSLLNLSFEQ